MMNDIIIVNSDCCFGFLPYTSNITREMDENDHDMIILIDNEPLRATSKKGHFYSTLYDFGSNGFHVNKASPDGLSYVSMIFCDVPNGRRLLSSHCMINGKSYDVKEFSIQKYADDEEQDGYYAICRLMTRVSK